MTTTIFHYWFQKFVEKVETRPILLVFDGHMTHLSLATVELAKAENVSLIKLPAHCTDVLQPLDVSCFSPLKAKYEQFFANFVHRTGGRQQLSKAAFCNLISSIWFEGLTKENIISGFTSTGNVPVDSSKYKLSRLDKVKLQTYNDWKAKGAPVDSEGGPILEKETEHSAIINDANVDNATLENAVKFSVATAQSPVGSKRSKPKPRLPFSVEAFDDSLGSTAESAQLESTPNESAQLESTPNESGNASKASDGLSQADILELLQNNAPSGYKYCLTLVLRGTDTLEKVLKNRVVSTKKVNPTTGGKASKPTQRKISMHGAVIRTAELL